MRATGSWPVTNTFSFTAHEHPWIDPHWGFQLLLYGAYLVGGEAGCALLATVLVAATTAVLYRTARRWLAPAPAGLLIAVALTIASPRLMPRPELATFLLLAIYLAILERPAAGGSAVWALVPLQALWANVQGLYPLGLVVIGGYWAGATLAFLPLPEGWRSASGLARPAWRRLTAVLVLATAVGLLNPYGVQGLLFPLELLTTATGGALVSSRIGELRGPFEAGHATALSVLWLGLVVAVALSFLLRVRAWYLGRLLVAAAFAVLSTRALRHMSLFAIVAVPVVAANLGVWLATVPESPRRRLVGRALAVTVPLALLVLTVAVATNQFSRLVDSRRELGLGLARARFPVDAVTFIERAGIEGRPFNCLAMGGYLAWRRHPEAPIFVDGRLEAYPADLFRTYFRVLDDPKTWPVVVERYKPDYAILYHAWPNRLPLVTYLAAGHGWALVYYDENAAIFVPEDDAHRAMRERAATAFAQIAAARLNAPAPVPLSAAARLVDFPVAERWRAHRYGEFLRTLGFWAEAARAYEEALAYDPSLIDSRFWLGLAYWRLNQRDRALAEWREVTRRDPSFEPARRALADAAAGPPSSR